jgi:acetylornithine deacetylase/succinyl-diaminopimelate desuccinylase-like protein
LEVNGIFGGYEGEGFKGVLPSEAHAKISCRLIGEQNPEEIMDLIEAHIHRHSPAGVTVRITRLAKGNPFEVSTDHPYMQAAAKALEQGFEAPVCFARAGAYVPVVDMLVKTLRVPIILMGFGLPGDNIHAPNEHFLLEHFDKGLITLCCLWQHIAAADKKN